MWLLLSCSSGTSDVRIALFTNVSNQAEGSQPSETTILLGCCVFVNLESLKDMQSGDAILHNLFPDTQYTAILDRDETQGIGYAWIGHLESVDNSQVTMVIGAGQMADNVALPDKFYQIRYVGVLTHAIYQVDQSAFPDEAESIAPTYRFFYSGNY